MRESNHMKTLAILIACVLSACGDNLPDPNAYDPDPWGDACERPISTSTTTCAGFDGTIGWCVQHGHYTYTAHAATWTATAPDSCELACHGSSYECPAGSVPRMDPHDECYCESK